MSKRLLAWLLTLGLLLTAILPACAEAGAGSAMVQQVEQQLQWILQSELTRTGAGSLQEWVNSQLAATAGQGAEWYAFALSQLRGTALLPSCDLSAYRDALTAFLEQGGVYGAATRQKYALCMLAVGGDAGVAGTVEETIGQQGVMSWVYGLHLLNNGCISSAVTPEDVVAQLVSLQLEDGGWAVMGQNADVDVTAMALQALAPHRQEPAVAAAVDKALLLLSTRQQADGGFISMGQPNPESAAQVLTALCALGIDPLTDERFCKAGGNVLDAMAAYRLADGGYSHTAGGPWSASATVQAFYSLAAYDRFLQGKPGLYLLDGAATASAGAPVSEAASVAVIGGADSPTAIFLASAMDYRMIAVIVIVLMGVVWCAVLLLRGKRNLKSYLAVLLVVSLLIGLVLITDIQSTESYYGSTGKPAGPSVGSVTLEIRCDTLPGDVRGGHIPADGTILPVTILPIAEGDTVYSVLTAAARQYRIQLDARGGQGMIYLAGIQYLYEQAHGDLSGWMYFVNGQSPSVGCDQYALEDGDTILWAYTCEMGADLR